MTKTVEDCALLFGALSAGEAQPLPPSSELLTRLAQDGGLTGLRIGVVQESVDEGACTEEVRNGLRTALGDLSALGAAVVDVSLPLFPVGGMLCGGLSDVEGALVHRHRLRQRPEDFDFASRRRLLYGSLITGPEYVKLSRLRSIMRRNIMHLLESVDLLATPTQAETAPPLATATGLTSKEAVMRQFFGSRAHRGTFSLGGVPCLSVPVGFGASGLPLSIQLIGKPFDEDLLFRVGAFYQGVTNWHEARPKLD